MAIPVVTGFLIKKQWACMIKNMDNEKLGELVKALTEVAFEGVVYDGNDPIIKPLYDLIGTDILYEQEKYYEKCMKMRANANKRYKKKDVDESALDIDAYGDPDAF